MDLQNWFYVVGIITMGLMLIMIIALVVAVFVIRAKVVALHQALDRKLRVVSGVAGAVKTVRQVAKKRHH